MKLLQILIIIFLLISCESSEKKNVHFSKNGFPDTVTNMSMVNSIYDDYNSAQTGDGRTSGLIFSSNRNSKGKDFDFVQYNRFSIYHKFETNIVSVSAEQEGNGIITSSTSAMLDRINSEYEEFGPFVYPSDERTLHDRKNQFLFFYAQETNGNLDLKFMENRLDSIVGYTHYTNEYGPFEVSALNTSEFNEGYISIQDNKLYYCTDKTGNFDLHSLELSPSISLKRFLTSDSILKSEPIEILNSPYHDKCPYLIDNLIVFTSNREGGFGGYDLWYSLLIDNNWSQPINFGPKINSKYDEFRPIIKDCRKIRFLPNDMLIFSSNRPNGQGGFDLYYIGIDLLRNKEEIKIGNTMYSS